MIHFPRWKIALILIVCLGGILLALPNFIAKERLEGLPSWFPSDQINLGLDLQGGAHLLLEVDLDSVFREQVANLVQSMRNELRQAQIGYTDIGVVGEAATVVIRNPDERSERGRAGESNLDHARRILRAIEPGLSVRVEGNRLILTYDDAAIRDRRNQTMTQSIEIVRRRVDEFGTSEPTIQRQGDNRILVQLPGVDDPERVKRLLGQTAQMNFHLLDERFPPGGRVPGVAPPGSILVNEDPSVAAEGREPITYVLQRRVMLSGDTLVDAQPTFQDGQPVVSFRFDSVGARQFARITQANVGRPFAIVLDNQVISAPVIREPILGGSGIISGNFSVQETNDLAVLLRAGALPAPMQILEERTVGPDLGADSIAAGTLACIIGFILVLLFMGWVYSTFGLFANIALIINLTLLLGLLSLLQATLTLPGIAGIILTIGMAVDANVLIFERIREEIRQGRTTLSAVDSGYRRALTTIIDANLTTLIAAVILFEFGSGPVKGFAVTLAIGLLTSMFSAIMVTRLMVIGYLRMNRFQRLPI